MYFIDNRKIFLWRNFYNVFDRSVLITLVYTKKIHQYLVDSTILSVNNELKSYLNFQYL